MIELGKKFAFLALSSCCLREDGEILLFCMGGGFGKVLMFFNCSLLHQLLIVLKSSGLIKPGGLSKNVCLIVILMIVKK